MRIPPPTSIHLDQQQTPDIPVITASPSGNNGITELGPQDQATEDEQVSGDGEDSACFLESTAKSEIELAF